MRIAVLGPIWLNIPPDKYGGTEMVVYHLVNGLVERGHDVTLFGPETAKVNSKLFPTVSTPLRDRHIEWENVASNVYHITEFFDHAHEFDVLHVHLNKTQDYIALPFSLYTNKPTIFTIHFKLPTSPEYADRKEVLYKYQYLPYTSISNSQRETFPLNFIKTVYNPLNITEYPFNPTPEDYFVWLGKIKRDKGTREALFAAKKAGVKLMVMGAVDNGVLEYLNYYKDEVQPLFDGKQIIWLGEVSGLEKAKILGGAKAFLNPINWEEPFGLVMVESQATGTPVISNRRGAASELILDGKTGFLVDSFEEMVAKIKVVDTLDRLACRKNIEEHFTVSKMVEGYEEVYNIVTDQWSQYSQKQQESIILRQV